MVDGGLDELEEAWGPEGSLVNKLACFGPSRRDPLCCIVVYFCFSEVYEVVRWKNLSIF